MIARPERPVAPDVRPDFIPNALKQRRQWVCWRYTWHGKKWTKPPVRVDGRPASTSNPKTWSTYLEVCQAYMTDTTLDGVGFVFTDDDPFMGIDLDHCVDEAGTVDPATMAVVTRLNSYTELTPSGRGLHVIVHSSSPLPGPGKCDTERGLEMYSSGRFFTFTGHVLGDRHRIRRVNGQAGALYNEWWPPQAIDATPVDPIEGGQVGALDDLDIPRSLRDLIADGTGMDRYKDDRSAALLGAATRLLLCGVSDESTLDVLSDPTHHLGEAAYDRRGSLDGGRAWLEAYTMPKARASYRDRATASTADDFPELDAPAAPSPAPTTDNPFLAAATDAGTLVGEPPPRRFAWDEWLPTGVVTGLTGPPGIAKSTLALQMSVCYALGLPFLGSPTAGGVAVYLTVEDDLDELWRRVIAICARLVVDVAELTGKLHLVPMMNAAPALVTADRDGVLSATPALQHIRQAIRHWAAGVVTLDLVGDFWHGNENSRPEVSAYVRQYLGRIARESDIGMLVLSHPSVAARKDGRGFSGSTAWSGSYRSGLYMDHPNPDVFADVGHGMMPVGSIAVTRVKHNYARPGAACVKWVDGSLEYLGADQLEADAETVAGAGRDVLLAAVEATVRADGWTTWHRVWTELAGELNQNAVRVGLNQLSDRGDLNRDEEPNANRTGMRPIYQAAGA